jgi:hypothetical protein
LNIRVVTSRTDWLGHLRPFVFVAIASQWALGGLTGTTLAAQAVTTAEIRGRVRVSDGSFADDADVRVTNRSTGVAVDGHVHHGRFVVAGLDVGGPYTVVVRRIGFAPRQRDNLMLTLQRPIELDVVLEPSAANVDTVHVVESGQRATTSDRTGTGMTISDSLIHRLPSLNRDMYDFVRLVPQISTRVGLAAGGLSGAGASLRFNNFLIDGASDRGLTANGAVAYTGAKSIPIDAVKEFQVLLAPFDIRYGDFAGALVNAVTRTGTNDVRGDGFAYFRDDQLARPGSSAGSSYDREQYGFSVGGPIVRDRVHFFVASEIQRLIATAPGAFVGQSSAASPSVPVSDADAARFASILRGYGLDPGSGGAVQNNNPLANLFARVDAALPAWNSRATVTENYAHTSVDQFSRAVPDTFSLDSYQLSQRQAWSTTSVQLRTNLPSGGYNHLMVSSIAASTEFIPASHGPVIQVVVPGIGSSPEILKAGTAEMGQGPFTSGRSTTLADNLSLPLGQSHQLIVGGQIEQVRLRRGGVSGSYGTWTFPSLDALESGLPDRFEINKDFGSASVPLSASQYGVYAGDSWQVTDRVLATFGLRADGLLISGHAPYNPDVDRIFGRRTDQMPVHRPMLSPRLGFRWDATGDRRDIIRGGIGVFTGRPPLSWEHSALYSYGTGVGTLRCGPLPTDSGAPPRFVPDYRAAPTACANGAALASAPLGAVDLVDRNLRLAQTARASLAYDRALPWGMVATVEGLATRNLSDFLFVNLNLKGPQGFDRNGRVMYGAVNASGIASPARLSSFSEVIDLTNDSHDHSYDLSARLEKRFTRRFEMTASYTYSHVLDTQLPIRAGTPGIVDWSMGRVVSGRHDDLTPTTSLYDLPHRVVVAMTYAAPWRRWPTDLSMYFVGESGSPFTDIAGGIGHRGDLNADGAANDPIYVPRSALDSTEIRFSGLSDSVGADNSAAAQARRVSAQQTAFENLIASTPCLRRQRGTIMSRNSCRQPSTQTTIASVRQSLSTTAGHTLAAQLDVYNLMNLLNARWGHQYQVGDDALLAQVAWPSGTSSPVQPLFRYDATRPRWITLPTESAYQLQLSVRYSF